MIIKGKASWYVKENPVAFNPLTANIGDRFIVNGQVYNFINLIYSEDLDKINFVTGYIGEKDNLKKEFKIDEKFACYNDELLNLTNAMGLPINNQLYEIAMPKALFTVVRDLKLGAVFEIASALGIKRIVRLTDKGPHDSFVKQAVTGTNYIIIDGRCCDCMKKVFYDLSLGNLDLGIIDVILKRIG